MKTTATNRKIRTLLTGVRNQSLIPRPEFQRRLVWSNKHKRAFLQTVLMEYPFPEIYIAAGEVNSKTGEGTEMLVDGQQRITTLHQYFSGSKELPLAGEIPSYAALPEDKKIAFLEYEVVVRDLGKLSIEQIKEVFQRINSTRYALNAMEIQNARYDGAFKQFAEQLAEEDNGFFERHNVFTASDIRRMHDIRFGLTFVTTIMSTYFNRDDELETYLEQYNDEFQERDSLKAQIQQVYAFIEGCRIKPDSRAWKKADLLTLLVEVHRALFKNGLKLNPIAAGTALNAFYDKVDRYREARESDEEVAKYYRASIQATNDRGNRIIRGKIIQDILARVSEENRLI